MATFAAAKTLAWFPCRRHLTLQDKADLITNPVRPSSSSAEDRAPPALNLPLRRQARSPDLSFIDSVDIPWEVLLDQEIARPQCHYLYASS